MLRSAPTLAPHAYAPRAAPAAAAVPLDTIEDVSGDAVVVGSTEDLVVDAKGLADIKNVADNKVVTDVCQTVLEGFGAALDLVIMPCASQYIVIATGITGRVRYEALQSIHALNAERYSRYNPIEEIYVERSKTAPQTLQIVVEVRKIECSNQVAYEQMRLIERGDDDGASDESDADDDPPPRSRKRVRVRERDPSPPPRRREPEARGGLLSAAASLAAAALGARRRR